MELLERASTRGNQQRQGSWWPPPFWGALIVNILSIAKASKGVVLYLELSGLVEGPGGCWGILCPLLGQQRSFSSLTLPGLLLLGCHSLILSSRAFRVCSS